MFDVVDVWEGGNCVMGDDGGGVRARVGVGVDVGEMMCVGMKCVVECGE